MVREGEFRDHLSKLDVHGNEWDTSESAETAVYSVMLRCKCVKIKICIIHKEQEMHERERKSGKPENSNVSHEPFSPMPFAELSLPIQSYFRLFEAGYLTPC